MLRLSNELRKAPEPNHASDDDFNILDVFSFVIRPAVANCSETLVYFSIHWWIADVEQFAEASIEEWQEATKKSQVDAAELDAKRQQLEQQCDEYLRTAQQNKALADKLRVSILLYK
jgi:hypothetical protein